MKGSSCAPWNLLFSGVYGNITIRFSCFFCLGKVFVFAWNIYFISAAVPLRYSWEVWVQSFFFPNLTPQLFPTSFISWPSIIAQLLFYFRYFNEQYSSGLSTNLNVRVILFLNRLFLFLFLHTDSYFSIRLYNPTLNSYAHSFMDEHSKGKVR